MNWALVLCGLAVHLVFFYSLFDIYFTSPLVHGMSPHRNPLSPPAQRLVLFVADGLRADKLFELDEEGQSRAPYIRNIVKSEGAWGVSHTRVPTESRPGNVAIAAGFYEDVSAVAKGWKENPVDYDSVFNESRYTWGWGSPDILPMFAKGASGDHVFIHVYPAESEDFAGEDSSKLDTWVFDGIQGTLSEAANDLELSSKLRDDKVIFFLHLLGIDTNGHAHKPYSTEYLKNIRLVDEGIKDTVRHLEEFFGNDDQTAYVLTSDHGMTNWGSHGAGHPTETLTPLVAWGAGVRMAKPPEKQYEDDFQKEWQLSEFARTDVNQADIAALMASLLGIPFPLNSVGVLPVDYLDDSEEFKAQSLFANARQIVEQFEVKMLQKQSTTFSFLWTPYSYLLPSRKIGWLREINQLIAGARYKEAMKQSLELIDIALDGLNYYHNYDRFFLGTCIALGFLAWMSYMVIRILKDHTPLVQPKTRLAALGAPSISAKTLRIVFTAIGLVTVILLQMQSLPWTYYVYCLIPVVLFHQVLQRFNIFQEVHHYVVDHGLTLVTVVMVTLGMLGLEMLVLSFFWRHILSLGFLALAAWPALLRDWRSHKGLCGSWSCCCLLVALFPMLPVVGRDANYNLVFVAGILTLAIGIYVAVMEYQNRSAVKEPGANFPPELVAVAQLCLVAISIAIVMSTSSHIADKQGLPLFNQLMSWTILGLTFVIPLLTSTNVTSRLSAIFLAFVSPYLLLSTTHEGLFFLALTGLMVCWLRMEHMLGGRAKQQLHQLDFVQGQLLGERQRYLQAGDIRCAFFFIFFLLTAFFGTGNIASINSFEPQSVLCFLTVFNPFVMGSLMMLKILIPFLLVTCTFNAIHVSVNVPTQSLFLLVLLMSDYMGLHFFFLVQDSGSWLEIGTSISHFVIVMAMICFMLILLALSKVFTTATLGRGGGAEKYHHR